MHNCTRTILFLLCLIAGEQLFAQDTTVTWLNNIDTSAFTISYDKKRIPEELYPAIGIKSLRDIANPGKRYRRGCVGGARLPNKRLNWMASDKNNHWILSVSYGGYACGTKFYFIDKDSGQLNTNIMYFTCREPGKLTLGKLIPELNAKRFIRGTVQ